MRFTKVTWKQFPAWLGLALILISVPVDAADKLQPSSRFRAQNDVLYVDDCSTTSGSTDSGGTNASVAAGANGWVYPTDKAAAPISSDYKSPERPGHQGVDLAGPLGTPIYASKPGTVVASGTASGFGNWIVIQHEENGKRVDSTYGHMSADTIKVKKGDKVTAGQHIAGIGSEGQSTGPHLHYEEWDGGRPGVEGGSGTERKPVAVYGESGTASGTEGEDKAKNASASGCCSADSGGTVKTAAAVTGGDGGGCGNKAPNDKQNMDQIWGYFVNKFQQKGYSKGEAEAAAAGIMGNMMQESNLNPAVSGGFGCPPEGPGVGIVQWCFSRQDNLAAYAAERGNPIDCLGIQLEFIWKEMEEGYSQLFEHMKTTDPKKAAAVFDHGGDGASTGIGGFEESYDQDNALRESKAADIYKQYTGKDPGSLSSSGNAGGAGCATTAGDGGIMSADCAALVAKYKELVGAGRIIETDKARQEKDLQNCTEDPIDCGTGGGKGGVHPLILRAFIGAAEAGPGAAKIWSFNTGHDCDGLNHPKGRAVDIVCNGNTQGGNNAEPKCNAMFKFLYDNYAELKLSELIWQYPPAPYSCGDPKIMCYIAGHADHIHVGVTPDTKI